MIKYKSKFPYDTTIQRRLLHFAGSIFIGYYLIPETLIYSISKIWILVLIISLVGFIELYRRYSDHLHSLTPLLREYEHKRPASYSYFALGAVILLAFFPQYISVPCILSAAICDPVIGIFKQQNKRKIGFLIGFFISLMLFYLSWSMTLFWIALLNSFIGAALVILAEHSSNLWIDDDFLMPLLPAVALYLLSIVIMMASLPLPNPLIYPLW